MRIAERFRNGSFAGAIAMSVAFFGALGATADAQSMSGSFCSVAQLRVNGAADSNLRDKLWEYTDDKPPLHPVLGWVEMECRMRSDAVPLDIAKRVWFSVARRGGPPMDQSILELSDEGTMSPISAVGVTHEGLALFYNVTPGHDCVFTVQIWSETCPKR